MRSDYQLSWFNRIVLESCKTVCMEQKIYEQQSPRFMNREEESQESEATGNRMSLETDNNTSSKDDTTPGTATNATTTTTTTTTTTMTKKRPFDVVIFAASSSVGRFVVEEMALVVDKYYTNHHKAPKDHTLPVTRDPFQFAQASSGPTRRQSVPRHLDDVRWAVAGRSAMKLNETLCRAELSTGIKDLSTQVPVLLADLNHHKSLLDMCAKSNLVINCAGPYSMHGEILVRACLESGTNYIDVAHESNFIEKMRRDFHARARKVGIYIINGCGFQSMSAEMGLNFMKQVADGQIDEVKIILNLSDTRTSIRQSSQGNATYLSSGIVSSGMWSSLLTERATDSTPAVRYLPAPIEAIEASTSKESDSLAKSHDDDVKDNDDRGESEHKRPLLQRKDTQSLVRDVVDLRNRNSFSWLQLLKGVDQAGKGYCLPTSQVTSEESQLIRGEMNNYELRQPDLESTRGWRPVRCSSFLSLKSISEVIMVLIWFFIFNFLVRFSPARKLMQLFPTIFSLGNVVSHKHELQRDSVSHIKFCQTLLAYGTPGDDSGDPLEHRDKNLRRKQELILVSRVVGPEPNHVATATFAVQAALTVILELDHLPEGGGVMTPGAAFAETNIIYQLRRRNIKFEVLKKA